MMKKTILALALVLLGGCLYAQNPVPVTSEIDSLPVYEPLPDMDISYVGKNIYNVLATATLTSGTVSIDQPQAMTSAMSRHVSLNESRKITGYRVRIFFDNSQNARQRSESVAGAFSAAHPGIPVYRSYASPFFKVTVGDFRTRDEAQLFAQRISGDYSSVFLVKETINYPTLW